ncbi:MAG: serine/threonine protein kinase [Acidobacteria bacterium]|nr:MAG: serine/threonine protein kinase [Acidobacteriota bacterium]
MTPCAVCSSEIPEGKRFCSDCGSPVAPDATPTRTAAASLPVSSPSLDSGRFTPGALVGERYRIIGLLGRGGMGEVYRADDLKLSQPVALKFLPVELERDAGRLGRFLNEVRLALRVTHANVCRVHDIGEVDGQHFISMEYIDGEDLATLLRRIGRLPEDKALQIARQLCAGVAAAHEEGILHRDLKPANVMIDGRGRARITDFGLAGLAEGISGADVRAGTPAYMAPEQIAGTGVSVRSDIYSLGLVLYELFTGKAAYRGRTSDEIARLQETSPTRPSSHVSGMDPAVEAVILRCLERDPAQRPDSALAVAAALPGGDPLAAALAAGETPSPRMVADAGTVGGLKPGVAWACLIGSLVFFAAAFLLGERSTLMHHAPLELSAEALAEKARETIRGIGYDEPPIDESYGFQSNDAYLQHISESDSFPTHWEVLRTGQPSVWGFWFRQSPRPIVRTMLGNIVWDYQDPPHEVAGMVGVVLDAKGRLLRLDAVPAEHDPGPASAGEPQWADLFTAAGFDIDAFTTAQPEWSPPVFADRRAAWEGAYPDAPEVAVRVEAAAYRGRPVAFRIIEPWTRSTPTAATERFAQVAGIIGLVLPFLMLGGAAVLARYNLKVGRSDRRGAFRLALYLMTVRMLVWLIGTEDLAEDAVAGAFTANLAWSLYRFGAVWLFYIALEPYLRRFWPRTMVSWTRLLDGRLRDPLVGRDVLIGCLLSGILWSIFAVWQRFAELFGLPTPLLSIDIFALKALLGLREAFSAMLFQHASFMLNGVLNVLMLLLLMRLVLRRTWLALTVWIPLFIMLINPVSLGDAWFGLVTAGLVATWWVLTFFRVGLLSLMLCFGLLGLGTPVQLSLDPSGAQAGPTWLYLVILAAIATYGFYVSLAGRPMLKAMLEPEN